MIAELKLKAALCKEYAHFNCRLSTLITHTCTKSGQLIRVAIGFGLVDPAKPMNHAHGLSNSDTQTIQPIGNQSAYRTIVRVPSSATTVADRLHEEKEGGT